jgi:hypothetical protein
MINRWQIIAVVGLAISVAVLLEWWRTGAIHVGILFSTLVAAAVVGWALQVFEKSAWRWRWLQGWFVHRPVIAGKWKVEITPLTVDPSIGRPRSRRAYRYIINQTYSTLFIRMDDGPESESESITADLRQLGDGSFEVIATYRSVPRARVRERSQIHHGTVRLRISEGRMVGSYWTDQQTHGEVLATRIAATTSCASQHEVK